MGHYHIRLDGKRYKDYIPTFTVYFVGNRFLVRVFYVSKFFWAVVAVLGQVLVLTAAALGKGKHRMHLDDRLLCLNRNDTPLSQ